MFLPKPDDYALLSLLELDMINIPVQPQFTLVVSDCLVVALAGDMQR